MNPTNPSNPSPGTYYETVLHSFTYNPDGGIPYAGLIMDAAGNLYGTTTEGGGTGYEGTVFELACTSSSATNSCSSFSASDRAPYTFGVSTSGDGYIPNAGLIMDAAGNLYGTTAQGGTGNGSTVFELVNSSGQETQPHSHESIRQRWTTLRTDVDQRWTRWTASQDATWSGGTPGYGTVFELMSPTNFNSSSDGSNPYAGLIMDAAGNLYGTTFRGGASNAGTVFELSHLRAPAAATKLSLTSSENPANAGDSIVLTATVTLVPASTGTIGGGTVTFYNGATVLGTQPVVDGAAAQYIEGAENLGIGSSTPFG